MRRLILAGMAVVTAATGAFAAHAPAHLLLIIPGESIGAARLGMSAAEIARINSTSPCPVGAKYEKGRAVRITTEWGGACQTKGGTQVGLWLSTAVREFGSPQDVIWDATYKDTNAVWAEFSALGIAFRILITSEGATWIQAIAVFPKRLSTARK